MTDFSRTSQSTMLQVTTAELSRRRVLLRFVKKEEILLLKFIELPVNFLETRSKQNVLQRRSSRR